MRLKKLSQKYCYFNTTNIFTLTFRSLSETFIRRSLFNSPSGSCHDSDVTWQEIGRTCGSARSSPRPGVASLSRQEPEEELNKLLLMKVTPFPQIDIIGAVVIVWRVRGKIIRYVLCNIVCNNCAQCDAHTL